MTLPAPRRGRTLLLASTAAALCALAPLVHGDPPPAGSAAGASGTGASTPAGTATSATGSAAATTQAPARKTPAKAGAPAPADKSSVSYSLGVSMGDQMHASGISSDAVNTERLGQGVRDALAGKVKMTDADRTNIAGLLRSARETAAGPGHHAAAKFLAENAQKPDVVTTKSGLQYKVISPGSGDSPKPTDEVTVNYRGTLLDGTEFDNSYKRGQPASFPVSRVIPGWTEGLQLMKPGAKYELFVPPQLAYDMNPPPGAPIPPGSMLVFEVELISVRPGRAIGGQPTMPHVPPPTQQAAPSEPASK
jgi:FKBP-type peptidyl-prolyl cis-trans isomerase